VEHPSARAYIGHEMMLDLLWIGLSFAGILVVVIVIDSLVHRKFR